MKAYEILLHSLYPVYTPNVVLVQTKKESSYLVCWVQFWAPWYRHMEILEQAQQRASKMMRSLEHLSYEEKLREQGLFSLEEGKLRASYIDVNKYLGRGTKEGPVTGQEATGTKGNTRNSI